jgi:L-histidine N-alpha-methyltransferase
LRPVGSHGLLARAVRSATNPFLDVRIGPRDRRAALAADVARGLTATPKSLPPKYFYDARGSKLFEAITRLPEYYLTRTEWGLLQAHAPALMQRLQPHEIVEIGAGGDAKTRLLLDARNGYRGPLRYIPVDVDSRTMARAARALTAAYTFVEVRGLVGDFEHHLGHVPPPSGRRLVAFLGSTIGNLDPPARHDFLREVRRLLGPDDRFLLGVDLVKDPRLLEPAYDDAAGVTRAFNRNILRVVNRALDADFVPEAFRHVAFYNGNASRIEMHLVPETPQSARIRALDLTVTIVPEESIWTESSYKFTRQGVEAMLEESGLILEHWHTDAENLFALTVAAPTLT